jgi:hypothetical protein
VRAILLGGGRKEMFRVKGGDKRFEDLHFRHGCFQLSAQSGAEVLAAWFETVEL